MFRCAIVGLFLTTQIGCWQDPPDERFLTSVPDTRPIMSIDASARYPIELGRGSGWHGLETVSIDESGTAVIFRFTKTGFETATFALTDAELSGLLKSIDNNRVLSLDREYHDEGMADGTQWVFLATQGEDIKSIYFNNHFPTEIVRFASMVDSILNVDSRDLNWKATNGSRDHENSLWDAIEKK